MSAVFLRPQTAKSNLPASLDAVKRMISLGWVAQEKIIGRRLQVHIAPGEAARVFTRHGQEFPRGLPHEVDTALHQWFGASALMVLEGDWVQREGRFFVCDLLLAKGVLLNHLTFPERHALLFADFIHPKVRVLPILRTVVAAWHRLDASRPGACGLVFRSTTSKGWPDSAIINCRSR